MTRRVFLLILQPRKTLRAIPSRQPHGKNNKTLGDQGSDYVARTVETLGDHGSDYVARTVETLGGASTGI